MPFMGREIVDDCCLVGARRNGRNCVRTVEAIYPSVDDRHHVSGVRCFNWRGNQKGINECKDVLVHISRLEANWPALDRTSRIDALALKLTGRSWTDRQNALASYERAAAVPANVL